MTICKDALLIPASRREANGTFPALICLISSSTELFMTGSLDRWIIRILLTEPLAVTMNVILTGDGFLYLIEGNHDPFGRRKGYNAARFKWIRPYAELNDNHRKVVLCHYPILCYNGQYLRGSSGAPKTYMLYGHVHNTWDEELIDQARALASRQVRRRRDGEEYNLPCQMINCFCMYSDYTPLTLDEWIEVDKRRRDG